MLVVPNEVVNKLLDHQKPKIMIKMSRKYLKQLVNKELKKLMMMNQRHHHIQEKKSHLPVLVIH
jgi:hypothetical protein